MDQKEAAALYLSDAAVREALVSNANLAKQQARSALAISHSIDVEGLAAVALAIAGDSSDATQLADDLAKRFPENTFVPVYLRGEAYLTLKQGNAAAAELQNIVDHPGIVQSEPIGALAQLQLGRAHALAGETDKARGSYQNFLTLWKDADPDVPILKQAKAEYARLH
jgi:tetratricopeptide (TPR) repeat protein